RSCESLTGSSARARFLMPRRPSADMATKSRLDGSGRSVISCRVVDSPTPNSSWSNFDDHDSLHKYRMRPLLPRRRQRDVGAATGPGRLTPRAAVREQSGERVEVDRDAEAAVDVASARSW